MQVARTKQDFAKLILAFNYGELKGIASDFAAMVVDKDPRLPPETTQDFAELLYDWAEAQDGA